MSFSFAPQEFTGDDGSADPALRALIASTPHVRDLVAALRGKRLLVALVQRDAAEDDDHHDHDHHHDDHHDHDHDDHDDHESAYMAVVSMVNAAGEKGLLAFTGLDSLAAWQANARPKPSSAGAVAQMAIEDGAAAVVIDVMGPVRAVIPAEHLPALLAGESSGEGHPAQA